MSRPASAFPRLLPSLPVPFPSPPPRGQRCQPAGETRRRRPPQLPSRTQRKRRRCRPGCRPRLSGQGGSHAGEPRRRGSPAEPRPSPFPAAAAWHGAGGARGSCHVPAPVPPDPAGRQRLLSASARRLARRCRSRGSALGCAPLALPALVLPARGKTPLRAATAGAGLRTWGRASHSASLCPPPSSAGRPPFPWASSSSRLACSHPHFSSPPPLFFLPPCIRFLNKQTNKQQTPGQHRLSLRGQGAAGTQPRCRGGWPWATPPLPHVGLPGQVALRAHGGHKGSVEDKPEPLPCVFMGKWERGITKKASLRGFLLPTALGVSFVVLYHQSKLSSHFVK